MLNLAHHDKVIEIIKFRITNQGMAYPSLNFNVP